MVALLKSMRRERNGAVADAMCTSQSGLNYGVSLPTVREIARAEEKDYDFAKMLWTQDVRELRLAALHIAEPERLTEDEFALWADGIRDEELSEEAAFALLSHAPAFPELFTEWIESEKPLLRYAALQAASRYEAISRAWIAPAVSALDGAFSVHETRLVANGVIALLSKLALKSAEDKAVVKTAVDAVANEYVREEMGWRLEY